MNFTVQVPINNVSFGQVSFALLKEFYALGLQPSIFPIGPVEVNGLPIEQDFANWIQSGINKSIRVHSRKTPTFKLWHVHDSFASLSNKQLLYSFYELDSPTDVELNIVSNIDKVVFSSKHAAECFTDSGAQNVSSIPLGFDKHSFFAKEKPFYPDGRIVFNLLGKLERRKHHAKIIEAWIKKYGNNPKYFLQCAIYNPFFQPQEMDALYKQIMKGRNIFNIEFYPFFGSNADYNSFLNSCDIVLGMSGGEGWGLPEFNSVALGKHAVIHNCSSYSDWADDKNAVLVNPCGKVEAYDNKFFQKGMAWNQGNIFVFDDDEFLNACDAAIKRVQDSPCNWEGIKLQNRFSYRKMADSIISEMEKL
jgi:glycosyltransferase involved in cell wall biosynthesis